MNSYESDVIVLLSFLRACLLLVARWFTDGHAVAVITLDLFFFFSLWFSCLLSTPRLA